MNRLLKYYPALLLVIPFFVLSTQVADAFMETVLWSLVTGLFGRMMVFGGWLLNIGINDYVIGFGSNFLTSGVGVAVDSLWVTVRDLFNLTFIFGLVYLGFKMILNSGDSQTKRWLIHLILAALLVNFSLFITKFIIDMSNILAAQLASGFATITVNGVSQIGVSNAFMDALGVTSTFFSNGGAVSDITTQGGSPYGYIFGSAILFIIGAFVFGAGGLLLMIRYGVLMLYMILSPLMFLGWVFPGLQSVSTKYWKGFLSRAFFAPIYILMLYFASKVLTGFFQGGTGAGNSNFAATLANTGPNIQATFSNTFPPFVLTCVFLIAALVIAQKMGADGASQAIKMGKSGARTLRRGTQRAAGGLTAGGAGMVGRNVVGKRLHRLANDDKFKKMAASSSLGRAAYAVADRGAKSSFDVRSVGGIGKKMGIGEGKGKGGFDKTVKDKKKKEDDFLDAIGTTDVKDENGEWLDQKDKNGNVLYDKKTGKKLTMKDMRDDNFNEIAKDYQPLKEATATQNEAEANNKQAKQDLDAKKAGREGEKGAAVASNQAKIKELEGQLNSPDTKNNPLKQTELKKQIEVEKQEVTRKEAEFDQKFNQEVAKMEEAAKETESKVKAAQQEFQKQVGEVNARAESMIVYANQLAYQKQVQKKADFWNKASTLGLSGAGATGAGAGAALDVGAGAAVAGGLAGYGGIVATTAASAHGYRTQEVAKHINDRLGTYGQKKAKFDKSKKTAELTAQALKDLGVDTVPEVEPTTQPEPETNEE